MYQKYGRKTDIGGGEAGDYMGRIMMDESNRV